MRRFLIAFLALIWISPIAFGAKYAGEFLYLGVGGKPLALGGAFAAGSGSVLSGYYNPAGLVFLDRPQAAFMHSETFGSLINHDYLAYARPVGSGSTEAALGLSLFRLGGGGIDVTGIDQDSLFYVIKEESHADYATYISYSRKFGARLSGGISAKLIYRNIVDESAFGIGLDIGGLYSATHWATFGLNLQDATTTLLSYSTGTKESVNPTAKMGSKFHGRRGGFSASFYTDADIRFENRDYSAQVSTGFLSLDLHLGLEASYHDKISARVGSDIGNLTLGVGLRVGRFNIDLAMRDHSDLDNTILASLVIQM